MLGVRVVTNWELRAAELAGEVRGWMRLHNAALDSAREATLEKEQLLEQLRQAEDEKREADERLERALQDHDAVLEKAKEAAEERRKEEKRKLARELQEKADERVAQVERERDALAVALAEAKKLAPVPILVMQQQQEELERVRKALQTKREELTEMVAKHDKLSDKHRQLVVQYRKSLDVNQELRLKQGELEVSKEMLEAELVASERHYNGLAETSRNAGKIIQQYADASAKCQRDLAKSQKAVEALRIAIAMLSTKVGDADFVEQVMADATKRIERRAQAKAQECK